MAPLIQTEQDGTAVRIWLYALCGLIFAMILVGGATRLTDSGLSITEWQLIVGVIPPLSETAWLEAFEQYKKIPEYQIENAGMSLEAFKAIYWWEWAHRFLGRFIGIVFLLPFLYFLFQKQLSRSLIPKLVLMFILGGLQGALGWYMVQSGLVERTDVSQYRLAAHLGMAVIIFGYIFWTALRLQPGQPQFSDSNYQFRLAGIAVTTAIFIQIILGALVAGLDAGQGYNTWPLMDGALIPEGLGAMTPWHLNIFENALTVQFNHRMAAYAVLALVTVHAIRVLWRSKNRTLKLGATLVLATAWTQGFLGIATLLARVPISLGLMHQGLAIILFALALYHLSQLLPAPAPDRR